MMNPSNKLKQRQQYQELLQTTTKEGGRHDYIRDTNKKIWGYKRKEAVLVACNGELGGMMRKIYSWERMVEAVLCKWENKEAFGDDIPKQIHAFPCSNRIYPCSLRHTNMRSEERRLTFHNSISFTEWGPRSAVIIVSREWWADQLEILVSIIVLYLDELMYG